MHPRRCLLSSPLASHVPGPRPIFGPLPTPRSLRPGSGVYKFNVTASKGTSKGTTMQGAFFTTSQDADSCTGSVTVLPCPYSICNNVVSDFESGTCSFLVAPQSVDNAAKYGPGFINLGACGLAATLGLLLGARGAHAARLCWARPPPPVAMGSVARRPQLS